MTYYLSTDDQQQRVERVHFSDFVQNVEDSKVSSVRIVHNYVQGRFTDGSFFKTYVPDQDSSLIDKLLANKVIISAQPPVGIFGIIRDIILPLLLVFALLYAARLPIRGGSRSTYSKGGNVKEVRFEDVGGLLEAKEELMEIVDFLKNPKKYTALGAQAPKGVLLVGPPGNGKTYLAKAIACQANVPFFYMSGSSFVEMFVGLGASRVRELFNKATAQAPSLIFIDEIDAIGTTRGAGMDAGSKESEKTLNELLVGMDGFASNSGVIVIGATNRDDVLDKALLRRFERKIYIYPPNFKERLEILQILTKNKTLAEDVDLQTLAQRTAGCSAADLKLLVNEGALLAARYEEKHITQAHLNTAIDRIFLGLEKKHTIMTEKEKELTAYHESGHAIAVYYLEGVQAIHKVTIVPRGHALGMVAQLPKDQVHISLKELKNKLIVAAAGRAAEIYKYGLEHVTTGAASDIQYATNLAFNMLTKWGLSSNLGAVDYDMQHSKVFNISDQIKDKIAQETKILLDWAQNEAIKLIQEHSDKFELLANTLLKQETLISKEVEQLLEQAGVKNETSDVQNHNIEHE